jgi:uncharacterized protein (DUF1800 family)
MAINQTSAARVAGHAQSKHHKHRNQKKKKRVWRDKHFKWVDNGDGTVTRMSYWVRHPHKPPPDHPRGPGPRPVPKPQKPPAPAAPSKFKVYTGPFGRLQATRLLNRAGFGPRPGQAEALARKGLKAAVHSLTRPSGAAELSGPAPVDGDGIPIAPADAYGHDHLWWLDRMIRTNHPLVERMALIFHDWFATSNDGVSRQQQMIDQSYLFRRRCFGSFLELLKEVTVDPAMLQWLNGVENDKYAPNENYGREMMELFTLGADRGAYTEDDVREQARALTGWTADWDDEIGMTNFRFDPKRHDSGRKTIFGRSGNWDWEDACRLSVENSRHASFFVTKLWSYFVPTPPPASTLKALIGIYKKHDYAIRPVLESILMHPDFYRGEPMVKPPVVYLAGLLRSLGRGVDTGNWVWICNQMGQQLFWPPNVSGWDDGRWLDTSTMKARWTAVTYALDGHDFDAWNDTYSPTESVDDALNSALGAWGWPALRAEQQHELAGLANRVEARIVADWQQTPYRALRQNALRQLIAVSPDMQLQ